MFDPTAFDNLKTVIEGTIYDRDLDGTITITNREDIIDISKLCRKYTITFHACSDAIEAEMMLYADLQKLAVELLPGAAESGESGAEMSLLFRKKGDTWHDTETAVFQRQWGKERCFETRTVHSSRRDTITEMLVHFNLTITEEMVRDVEDMVYFTIETLDLLKDVTHDS